MIGGWRRASLEVQTKYDPGVCNIDRVSVSDLPNERFEAEYRYQRPVIVTFPNGASDWTDPTKWTRDELVKAYSKWTIHSGDSLEIVRQGGNADHRSSFLDFINKLQSNETEGEPG